MNRHGISVFPSVPPNGHVPHSWLEQKADRVNAAAFTVSSVNFIASLLERQIIVHDVQCVSIRKSIGLAVQLLFLLRLILWCSFRLILSFSLVLILCRLILISLIAVVLLVSLILITLLLILISVSLLILVF